MEDLPVESPCKALEEKTHQACKHAEGQLGLTLQALETQHGASHSPAGDGLQGARGTIHTPFGGIGVRGKKLGEK